MKILVTGATGYIGGRLIPKLLEKGHAVRVLVRDPRRLQGFGWETSVEICQGDLENADEVKRATESVEAAYFLVHAMYEGDDFATREKLIAQNFADAAKNLEKVIYLGGLLPDAENVSEHLKSRAEVGRILRTNSNVTEFRAGPIIGSGSASFEMVRYLTERLPLMITPRWVSNEVQPIAIRNVIEYLIAALDKKPLGVVDVGADRLPFRKMIEKYANERGLKRILIPVPFFSPSISGWWIGIITPIPNTLAVPLVKGIVEPIVADTTKAKAEFPEIKPILYDEAIKIALSKIKEKAVETRWSGSLGNFKSYDLEDKEGMFTEVRTVLTNASPQSLYQSFTNIGGETGWLAWNWAWKFRGFLDKLVGGPGLSRGRRAGNNLRVGEELDFWRVEALEKDKLMRLRAEMIVPGKAWLQFEIIPKGAQTQLVQTALYAPKGLSGLAYWYASYPAHLFLFGSMASKIAQAAEVIEGNKPREEMPATI